MQAALPECACDARRRCERAALVATGVRNLRPLQLAPRERFNVFAGDNRFFPTVGVAVKAFLVEVKVTWVDWEDAESPDDK